mmetsp:Transcript_21797/g.3611  ORF Transcript_21797/g.3611 Transcript_21797/m.3611 type:complete len:83 (+) Transcript_21797:249-497(+)
MFLAIYNCFLIPIVVAFSIEDHTALTVLNVFTDVMFMVDIIFNFRTSYINNKGEEVVITRKIARNYLSHDFTFDLLASLPVD